jgi:hypothetical protein
MRRVSTLVSCSNSVMTRPKVWPSNGLPCCKTLFHKLEVRQWVKIQEAVLGEAPHCLHAWELHITSFKLGNGQVWYRSRGLFQYWGQADVADTANPVHAHYRLAV